MINSKFGGVRIEPSEIESAIRSLPGVKETAVMVREDSPGDSRLVAYYVPHRRNAETIEERDRNSLENGMSIVQVNQDETDYLYSEIFAQQRYMQNGVRLPKSGLIVDVGANIGMFTLFANLCSPNARVLAFEPISELFQLLSLNTELYSKNTKLFPYGLSDKTRTESINYYRDYTLASGRASYEEVGIVAADNDRLPDSQMHEYPPVFEQLTKLIAGKLQPKPTTVSLRRLSDVLREESGEEIGLLKINVQYAELDVVRGIEDRDWPRIKQVVIQSNLNDADNPSQSPIEVIALLKEKGFIVATDEFELFKGFSRYTIYARREIFAEAASPPYQPCARSLADSVVLVESDIRERLKNQLPTYLLPTDYVRIDHLPLNRSGKVDRHALPPPGKSGAVGDGFVAPLAGIQTTIANIWKTVLNLEKVGTRDNFFDIGGHSLKLVQVHMELCKTVDKDVTMLDLFQHPTIESLTLFLESDKPADDLVPQRVEENAKAARDRRMRIKNRMITRNE